MQAGRRKKAPTARSSPTAARNKSRKSEPAIIPSPAGPLLGIEGGGTRTSVILLDAEGKTITYFQTGPAVLSLMSDRDLLWHLRAISTRLPQPPIAVGIGLAGARTEADRERL